MLQDLNLDFRGQRKFKTLDKLQGILKTQNKKIKIRK